MRTFTCSCGNMLFFENSRCLRCHKETGFCPACQAIVDLVPRPDGGWRCGNVACGAGLLKCANYQQYDVCNRCVLAPGPASRSAAKLCDYCCFNQTIPDLSVPGFLAKWYRLERERRVLNCLDLLGLPYRWPPGDPRPRLRFDFKADAIPRDGVWHCMGQRERVFTGHAGGLITINVREADDVERERLRIVLGEEHRTLIGHFRHEIAHFVWEVHVKGRGEEACRAVFGDHRNPTYQEALTSYYQTGAPPDWRKNYVSAYATMHPWEDFAETFATYLDMVSVLDTAFHFGLTRRHLSLEDFDGLATEYKSVGIAMNEINRSMGLLDLVPELLVEPVREKMRYVHDLISAASGRARGNPAG